MTDKQKEEIYQEYLEKGRAICQKYQEAAEVIREKNKVNGHFIRDASVREENALRKKKYEELKKLAEIYRARCNE